MYSYCFSFFCVNFSFFIFFFFFFNDTATTEIYTLSLHDALPILSGLVGVLQRYLSSAIGEGVIFDLRRSLYQHMQRMSLRFFTSTKTGELMSRLNNDVIGAQQAVTSTITSIISNVLTLVA